MTHWYLTFNIHPTRWYKKLKGQTAQWKTLFSQRKRNYSHDGGRIRTCALYTYKRLAMCLQQFSNDDPKNLLMSYRWLTVIYLRHWCNNIHFFEVSICTPMRIMIYAVHTCATLFTAKFVVRNNIFITHMKNATKHRDIWFQKTYNYQVPQVQYGIRFLREICSELNHPKSTVAYVNLEIEEEQWLLKYAHTWRTHETGR